MRTARPARRTIGQAGLGFRATVLRAAQEMRL